MAGILALIREWKAEQGRGGLDGAAAERAIQSCLEDNKRSDLLVGERGGTVAAYIAVHWIPFPMVAGTEGYISDLIVQHSARGLGLGTDLVAAVEVLARDRGCGRLTLNNRVTAESFARQFYPKRGFQQRHDFANFVKRLG